MKNVLPEDEAFALIEATTSLFHSVTDTFLKHAKEGCIKIREESANFHVTMKLERKTGGETMNADLNLIGGRIADCFAFVKANLSLEELNEFQKHLSEQEALFPLLQPTAYMDGGGNAMALARERVEPLRAMLETIEIEKKLLEGAK